MREETFRRKVVWASFICCLLVIWNHSGNADLFGVPGTFAEAFEMTWSYQIIRTDIPCFMMLSGYLFFRGYTPGQLAGKWRRRLRSLVLPYLLWNLLYWAADAVASRIPVLSAVTGRVKLPVNVREIWRASVFYSHNPVFWFMFQLILLVLLAPVFWIFLRSRAGTLLLAAVLLAVWWFWPSLPLLNQDSLIYYLTGAVWAVWGRRQAEAPGSPGRMMAGLGLMCAGICCCRLSMLSGSVRWLVLYLTLFPQALWLLLGSAKPLGEPAWWMKATFFIYAFHFIPVRLVNKLAGKLLYGSGAAALVFYLIMPAIAVAASAAVLAGLNRLCPKMADILSGGRNSLAFTRGNRYTFNG